MDEEAPDEDHNPKSDSYCDWCGGQKEWCEGCQMWSRTCCEEYGTCMCS